MRFNVKKIFFLSIIVLFVLPFSISNDSPSKIEKINSKVRNPYPDAIKADFNSSSSSKNINTIVSMKKNLHQNKSIPTNPPLKITQQRLKDVQKTLDRINLALEDGQIDQIEETLEVQLASEDSNSAKLGLAAIAAYRGDFALSIELMDDVDSLDKVSLEFKADSYAMNSEWDRAKDLYHEILDNDCQDCQHIHLKYITILSRLNDSEALIFEKQRYMDTYPDDNRLETLVREL